MTLSVSISGDAEERLRRLAQAAGVAAEDIASRLLERSVRRLPDLAAISGPIAAKFKASGLTEDQLAELLEEEKHAMRADKRKKAS